MDIQAHRGIWRHLLNRSILVLILVIVDAADGTLFVGPSITVVVDSIANLLSGGIP